VKQVKDKQTDERLRICSHCGAWVRRERADCPWCGAPTADAQADTEPFERPVLHTLVRPGAPETAPVTVAPRRSGRPVRFWLGLFLLAGSALAIVMVGLGMLGTYQGLRDRAVTQRQQAVEFFQRGQAMLQSGRYELAGASFEAALRLEPDWEAAQQGLAAAQAAAAGGQVALPTYPTFTPAPGHAERLWAEAQSEIQDQQWAEAALTLEQLQGIDPGYQPGEVSQALAKAYIAAGLAARDTQDFQAAISYFDRALATDPENREVLLERQLASAYYAGLTAWEHDDWPRATSEFRRVYLLNASYLDVTRRLSTAHIRYGDAFWQRSIWCDAANEYRAALQLTSDNQASQRFAESSQRCEQRQISTPIPLPTTPPTATAMTADELATPGADDPLAEPTATEATPAEGEPQATPSATPDTDAPLVPPSQPAAPGDATIALVGTPGEDFSANCSGQSIRGTISAANGTLLAGITVIAVDEWGNVLSAESKTDPAGFYDIPITANVTSYRVSVRLGDGSQSAAVTIRHDERFANSAAACHVLNWQYRR
jgi:tetratricopeptide (TPR) repeat protein